MINLMSKCQILDSTWFNDRVNINSRAILLVLTTYKQDSFLSAVEVACVLVFSKQLEVLFLVVHRVANSSKSGMP